MNKLLAALVAGLFAAGAFAQQPAPAPKAERHAAAVHKSHKSKHKAVHAVKKHKVRHVAKARVASTKKV